MENQNKTYMYPSMVEDEEDIIGMLAYCIYKKEKMDYIKNHKTTKNGEEPTKEELDIFQKEKLKNIDKYINTSKIRFKDLINEMFIDERKNILNIQKQNEEKE